MMDCSEPFILSIALMAMMPSAVYSPLPYLSSPQSLFSLKLRAREQAERKHCQRLLTLGKEMCGGVLEFDQDRILLEVICKQHGVPNVEVVIRKVGFCLVRLEATERSKLLLILCNVQNGLCAILTNLILQ